MLACKHASGLPHDMVRDLLAAGAFVDACTEGMVMAIHVAASSSTGAVVELLLEARSLVDPRDVDNNTPLRLCCCRDDDEAVKIARVLLDRGAKVNHRDQLSYTPLLVACRESRAALVELLLSCGADAKAAAKEAGWTNALILAACNRMHGSAIIALLVKVGVNVEASDSKNRTALDYGLDSNSNIMRVLAPLYQRNRQLANRRPNEGCPDPVGCMQEGRRFGADMGKFLVAPETPAPYSWATMRVSGARLSDVFDGMWRCGNPELWRWVGLEMRTPRHPETHETLLHLAAKSNNRAAVKALMDIWLNPLLCDAWGSLAIELTTDSSIRHDLLAYMALPPQREVMRWYGPYLLQQVRAFLLVLQRWKNDSLCRLPVDVRDFIILQIREAEACDCRKKERSESYF
jgi:hypothetical protein